MTCPPSVCRCLWLGIVVSLASAAEPPFSRDLIPPLTLASDGHLATVADGVKLDVYYNHGPKTSAAIYALNTGRQQLVLTPEQHQAILADLLKRKFTVIVADFRDKRLPGLELEKYVVQLTAAARAAADAPWRRGAPPATSKTETYATDYYILMPGFTVEREVAWFRYGDVPEALRRELARQVGKPFREADAAVVNTYDIIHPAYGPAVGVLTNYGSNEKGREDYCATPNSYLVMAFALKNLAIVHQQYFNDPVGGYHKGYDFYGDQFAACFIRHLKGNADRYQLDPRRICCFGHSKGSEVPGMLVNRLRATPRFFYSKVDSKKLGLSVADKTLRSPYASLPTDIACAIFGAGIANQELASERMAPWDDEPVQHISPFFIYADHRADTRQRTAKTVAVAQAHGVSVETAEQSAHTWPLGEVYDRASAFAERVLGVSY